MSAPLNFVRDIHRVGGASVPNLRLKPFEKSLKPPGISVLRASGPDVAAQQMRTAFDFATELIKSAHTVGSTTEEMIRATGFDMIHVPTRRLPNHHRVIHPDGVSGFSDDNLARLSAVFIDTTGH